MTKTNGLALGLVILAACSSSAGDTGGPSGGGVSGGGTSGGGTSGGGTSGGGTSGGGTGGGTGPTAGTTSTAGAGGAGTSGTGAGAGGAAGAAGTGGTPTCATTEVKTGACKDNATGVFAMKTVVDVWWQDDAMPPLVDPGRDVITIWLRGEISDVCEDGSGGKGTIKACGTALPTFKSDVNCDAFQIEFPDELWDSPSIPTFTTDGMTTGFEPGDTLTLATATGLLGIDLDDPNGTWPTAMQTQTFTCAAGKGSQCFPDDDGDGKPGITIRMGKIGMQLTANGCGGLNLPFVYRGAPLDALSAIDDNSVRAEMLQIGLRTRIGGAGAIGMDCSSGVGDSTAENLDSRVLDCQTTMKAACAPAQAQFVDEAAPNYHILAKGTAPPTTVTKPATQGGGPLDQTPSAGPRSSIVRLGDLGQDFSCAEVRGAAYPAL